MATNEGSAVEALYKRLASFPGSPRARTLFRTSSDEKVGGAWERGYKRLSQTEPENGPAKECQDFHERTVRASELANWEGEVPEFQISRRSS